ncbi:glucose-1-phosphate adenylyltransferase subunit GlgD [Hutsoniella sourekii]|uniref:glucose-1-phosphate adenylyltransferase subunit GlgD n=1 Tax=Hutsoniella sourekii TaxID=87650 RepID=UPI00048395C3|nr:glucose-1-phosphate adenylyltransferase subunit GlgD [Hutsoniella sourekii]
MANSKLAAIINLTENNDHLKPLTNNRPIASLPFAGRYRIIDFALSDISYANIDSVALFIGGSGRSIYDHIRSGIAWDLQSDIGGGVFTFSQQDWKHQYKIEEEHEDYYYNHRIYLQRSKAEYVYIAGSNIINNLDIRSVVQQHKLTNADVTVVYHNAESSELSAKVNENMALEFSEGHALAGFVPLCDAIDAPRVNVSLDQYIVSADILFEMMERALEDQVYKSINDLILHYINDYTINTYEYTGYTAFIDSIDNYFAANLNMLDRVQFNSLFHGSIPVLTKSKHGAPTYYSGDSNAKCCIVATDTQVYGHIYHSVINRRVTIEQHASVENSVILQGVKIGEGAEIKYAIIDKNTTIAPGAKVIGSPDNIIVIEKGSHIQA